MDVYNTEEEQVQAIKKWWKDNSLSIIAGIVIGASILGGYSYWNKNKQVQAQQASVIYSNVLSAKDKSENVELLKNNYSSTPYAALASLLLAKDEINNKNIEQAEIQLKWVVKNSSDDAIQHIAKQRLARLYLNQSDIGSAEEIIKSVKAKSFSAAYSEIRGDINLAKKLPLQARENYRLALSAITQADQRYAVIKMKLDDLTQAIVTTTPNGDKSK